VSLIVDGKAVDTKPLRVMEDPEVVLTAAERKRLYDMAMEMNELQRRATELANAFAPLNSRMAELAKEIGGRTDIPADVKTSFEAFNKKVTTHASKVAAPSGFGGRGGGGGFGGRGGGASENILARISQAKSGMMGGMWPTEQTMRAYNDAKVQLPKAIEDTNALFAKAAALSKVLEKHKLTLTAPAPVK
jgi:hypothetical protein